MGAYGELLTLIKIKKENYEGHGGHYIKCRKREAMEIAILGCAITIKLSEDKKCVGGLRLGYGVVVPTPIRCHETEQSMISIETGGISAEKVGKGALGRVGPRSGWRASREFRLQLIKELGKGAVRQVVINIGSKWDVQYCVDDR